jgi:hypothetical protein
VVFFHALHAFDTFALMTPQELITYFETATLPETLRLDRASTQLDVPEAVQRNIETMLLNSDGGRAMHRLTRIKNALETPYSGQPIPKL